MRSSGTTGTDTASDAAVTLLTTTNPSERYRTITNTGTVAGFVSVDGGTTWLYVPAGQAGVPSPSARSTPATPPRPAPSRPSASPAVRT